MSYKQSITLLKSSNLMKRDSFCLSQHNIQVCCHGTFQAISSLTIVPEEQFARSYRVTKNHLIVACLARAESRVKTGAIQADTDRLECGIALRTHSGGVGLGQI